MQAGRPIPTILDELTMLERELDAATNADVRSALEVVIDVLRAEYAEALEAQGVKTDDFGDPRTPEAIRTQAGHEALERDGHGAPVGSLDVERRPIDA